MSLEAVTEATLVDLGELRPEDVPASLHQFLLSLPGSVALRIRGRDPTRTRAVTALLHGNEPSGLSAVHQFLRSRQLPRTNLLIVVGAVQAAKLSPVFSHRQLPGGRDLNRCFLQPKDDQEGRLAAAVLDVLRGCAPEAIIDLHNNSGHNPAYGVGTLLGAKELGLTSLFAEQFVLSKQVLGALMNAFAGALPVVTIECGRRLDPAADACAYAGLCRYAEADVLPELAPGSARIRILHRTVRVRVRHQVRIGFGDHEQSGMDVTCATDVDRHNFQTLPAGSHVAWLSDGIESPFEATDEDGVDVTPRLFQRVGRSLQTARALVPIMMTTDAAIAAGDCLFYAVEPWTPEPPKLCF